MKVYKFGGASVRSADGVRNLCDIVREETEPLFVVVSAMGKTTNALEGVLERFMAGDRDGALDGFAQVERNHEEILAGLFPEGVPAAVAGAVEALYAEARGVLLSGGAREADYDRWYDRIVSFGELISTTIVSAYLERAGVPNRWIDMRRCFVTSTRHRDANINLPLSAPLLKRAVAGAPVRVFVGQGFIGSTAAGDPTTLGREGSDYSAAVAANILDAESLSIWKDVEGILNADPKLFADTVYIPELTYLDAIELAYSGAQIIHPKTIKPLQNKNIPLYVRPFSDRGKPGSVIRGEMTGRIEAPILILKPNQVLLSIRPKDFSFVIEDRMVYIFSLLEQYRIRTNLIQSSAVNLSVCVDASRHLKEVAERLRQGFRVVYNSDMELLTIRGYTPPLYEKYAESSNAYLIQKTRKMVRIVRRTFPWRPQTNIY